jgi:hypothetical protein
VSWLNDMKSNTHITGLMNHLWSTDTEEVIPFRPFEVILRSKALN